MKYCPKCGKQLIDNKLKFCPYCGSAIADKANKDKRTSKIPKPLLIGIPIAIIIVISIVVVNGLRGSSSSCEFGNTCSFSEFDITTSNIVETKEGVKVEVEFMNNTDTTYPISYSNFALVDNEKIAYSGLLSTNNNALSFESIMSNSKKKFTVYFDKDSFEDIKEIRFEGVSNGTYAIKLDAKAILDENERLAKEKEESERKEKEKQEKAELEAKQNGDNQIEESKKDLQENPPYILQKFPDLTKYVQYLNKNANELKKEGFKYVGGGYNVWRLPDGTAEAPSNTIGETITPWIAITDEKIMTEITMKEIYDNTPDSEAVDDILIHSKGGIKFAYKLGFENHPTCIIIALSDVDITQALEYITH